MLRLFAFSLFSSILFSCGLRYTPPPTFEQLRDERRVSLENQLSADYKEIGLKPVALLYGDPVTVKPASFAKLDSLFNLKYLAQRAGRATEDLDRQIEVQRGIVLSDSTELLYRETIWLEITGDTLLNFAIVQTFQNNVYKLRNLKLLESFEADVTDSLWAVMHFTERPFLRMNTTTGIEERNFYGYMKNHALELSASNRNLFLKQVFDIMRIANEERSLSTDLILRRLAAKRVVKEVPEKEAGAYTYFAEKVVVGERETYEVTVVEKEGTFKKVYRFDAYFYPID